MSGWRWRWTWWLERIISHLRRAIGAHAATREPIFARDGEDRWTTPRRYDERDLQVVSWVDRQR